MMGESRLCSYADGNDVAEGKRGDNHKSKSYWAAIGRDEIQRSVGVCFWCSRMGTFLNWKRGRKDFSIGEVLDLAETTWRVAYQMTSIFSIKYEPKPPPDNKNRVGVKNVCGEQRIYKIVFLRSRNSKPAVKPKRWVATIDHQFLLWVFKWASQLHQGECLQQSPAAPVKAQRRLGSVLFTAEVFKTNTVIGEKPRK